ncbi:solute carrier family 23 protein, partial [Staphylococcus aureus]|uniref:solute carrier family 23 protein n=1 Tax=Staphylococcus aureus TaxID=1280 RepID=UPI0010EEE2F9
LGDMLVALFMNGVIYVIIGILITLSGTASLMTLLPPVVVGSVLMVTGLNLAPHPVNLAMYENPGVLKGYNISFLIVAWITLLV